VIHGEKFTKILLVYYVKNCISDITGYDENKQLQCLIGNDKRTERFKYP